jgi:hypothetical protein
MLPNLGSGSVSAIAADNTVTNVILGVTNPQIFVVVGNVLYVTDTNNPGSVTRIDTANGNATSMIGTGGNSPN